MCLKSMKLGVIMCVLCQREFVKNLTVREKLNGLNEIVNTLPENQESELEHLKEVRERLLGEYAIEIRTEVSKFWRQG